VCKKLKNLWLFLIGFRTAKKRVYVIGRALYYQDELNYAEDGLVKYVLKQVLGDTAAEMTFGETIDRLYDKGAVPGLFKVILKPYAPTFLHRIWNKAFACADVVPTMKNSEIAAVLSDFFFFNTSWLADLQSMLPGLVSRTVAAMTASSTRSEGKK
jgi:hypothetical protein